MGHLAVVDTGSYQRFRGPPNVHGSRTRHVRVEVHPQYAENGWIYLPNAEFGRYPPPLPPAATARGPRGVGGPSMTTIVPGASTPATIGLINCRFRPAISTP